jgi:hypothetical protein
MKTRPMSAAQLFILCWAEEARLAGLKINKGSRVPSSADEWGAAPAVDFTSARGLITRGFLTEPNHNGFLEITEAGLVALQEWKAIRGAWRAKRNHHGMMEHGPVPGSNGR